MRDQKERKEFAKRRHIATTKYEKCHKCGKRTYKTENDAVNAIIFTENRAGVRVYKDHGSWHLTGG